MYFLISLGVMPVTGPCSNARSMKASSRSTVWWQTSRMSFFTAGVRQSRSFTKAWNSRVMPSQCRLSSRTDQLTIRSEEHTSELQSLMRISYAVFCLKKKIRTMNKYYTSQQVDRQEYINNRGNNHRT